MQGTRKNDTEKIAELEGQVAALKAALHKEHAAKVAAEDDVKRLITFTQSLTENLDITKIMLWAKKSEKLTDADLKRLRKDLARTIMNPDHKRDCDIAEASRPEEAITLELPPPIEKPPVSKKKHGRQPGVRTSGRDMSCFDILPQREVVYDLKQHCGDTAYGQSLVFVKEDRRQQLEYVRGHFRTKVSVTYVYRDADNNLVSFKNLQSPDFVKGGKLTNGAAAAVITDKVIWSLPLYRQAKRINMINGGSLVNAQLLSSYFLNAANLITPVWEDLLHYIKSQQAIHGDETRLLVVNDSEQGKKRLGQIWALSYQGKQAPAAFFKFYPSREGKWAKELYGDCKGVALQVDGYSVYASMAADLNSTYAQMIRSEEGEKASEEFLGDAQRLLNEGVLLVGCMAHARRKINICFEGIYKDLPDSQGYTTCNTILGLIGSLYGLEKTLRPAYASGAVDEQSFIESRKEQALPIVKKLKAYSGERLKVHEQEHNLHKALTYMVNQIDFIANYLESSELTPDNNFQESQIRGLAITRRNCLFASSNEGALAWSKLLTLLQTAILNKCDPTLYLKYVLDSITALMESGVKDKDVDWSRFRPWNIEKQTLQNAWDP